MPEIKMSALTKSMVERGYFLANLRKEPKEGDSLCSCGKFSSRCSFTLIEDKKHPRKDDKKEDSKHLDLTFEQVQQAYFDWLYLHGGLLIEHSLDTLPNFK